MINKIIFYVKPFIAGIILCGLMVYPGSGDPAAAQESPADLRLLIWSPAGDVVIGLTPAETVTLTDGSVQRLQTIWRLPVNDAPPQKLDTGLAPQLSSDGRWVTYTRIEASGQATLWGLEVATGTIQPLDGGVLATPDMSVAGDPAGQVFISPDGKKRAIVANQFFNAALWVGQENEPARLILQSSGEVFSDLSWRDDSTALAFIRTPLGSQTDRAGEVWRVDLPAGALTRLSRNNAVDRSPVWSPDGTRLAVIRNEQQITVPADRLVTETFELDEPALVSAPASEVGAMAQLTPPAAIRVIHHASNTCRSVPVGQIDTIPFEEYVKRVVPYEVFPSWPAETLKAQAVAARTYAWDKYLQDPDGAYHVTDWVNHQYMCDNTVASTNQAVDATAGEYLAYNGQIITAMFSAENSSPTKTNPFAAYLQAIDDPVSFGQPRNGHGYGMGQWGAQRWADQYNWSYQTILRHYYTGVTVEEANSGSDAAPPNVSLILPRSNHYLTTNRLYVVINTSDDGGSITQTNLYLSTPSETNLLAGEPGPANPAGYVIDISAWADQSLLTPTLVLTAEAFDAGGRRGVSPEVVLGLDRLAPSGLLTTAATLSGTTIITRSPVISLTLSAADATAGASQITLGRKSWEWEGENLTREEIGGSPVGQVITDAAALNGSAIQATVADDPPGSWSTAELTFPAPRQYRAYFRLKVSDPTLSSEVARLEVIDTQNNALIGLHRLRGVDFRAGEVYQEFHADFDYPTVVTDTEGIPIILGLVFQDTATITLDRLIVVECPIPLTPQPTYNAAHFRLKVIDGAGNVSDDLLVLPEFDYNLFLPLIRN